MKVSCPVLCYKPVKAPFTLVELGCGPEADKAQGVVPYQLLDHIFVQEFPYYTCNGALTSTYCKYAQWLYTCPNFSTRALTHTRFHHFHHHHNLHLHQTRYHLTGTIWSADMFTERLQIRKCGSPGSMPLATFPGRLAWLAGGAFSAPLPAPSSPSTVLAPVLGNYSGFFSPPFNLQNYGGYLADKLLSAHDLMQKWRSWLCSFCSVRGKEEVTDSWLKDRNVLFPAMSVCCIDEARPACMSCRTVWCYVHLCVFAE